MFLKIIFYIGITIHVIASLYLIITDVHPYTATPEIVIYSLYLSLALMLLSLLLRLVIAVIKKFK